MKLEDSIKKSIANHPSLYARLGGSYQESKTRVLNHYFLVLGNGYEWAKTKKPEEGGYLAYPEYKKRRNSDGYYETKLDLPYGKETYTGPDVERFFTEPYVNIRRRDETISFMFVGSLNDTVWKGFLSELPEEYIGNTAPLGESKSELLRTEIDDAPKKYMKSIGMDYNEVFDGVNFNYDNPDFVLSVENVPLREMEDEIFVKPYPFSEEYWPYAEIDSKKIKSDWRDGMIEIFNYARDYYTNDFKIEDDHCAMFVNDAVKKFMGNEKMLVQQYGYNKSLVQKLTPETKDEIVPLIKQELFQTSKAKRIDELTKAITTLEALKGD